MKVIHRYKPFLILIILFLLMSCSQKKVDNDPKEIVEMKGYVLAKELDTNKILVVPNISRTVVERLTKGELEDIAIAQDNGGVYFSVSKETYVNVLVGDQVLVKYDQFGDVKEPSPPIHTAESVEFIK